MKHALAITLLLLSLSLTNICTAQKQFSTVVIDPGHGGKDPGAIGSKYREKNIVLNVALKLGKMLNDSLPTVKTIYTRDTDVFIPLDDRANIANKNNADLFISIHANSVATKGIYGAETFVLGLHRSKENLEVAQKENSVITLEDEYNTKYEGFDPNQAESYIIFELMQNVYLEQSISFASHVQSGFVNAGRADRGVKQAGFLVLRQTSMPSVLVELGFISDKEEEAYMGSEEGATQLATSIFEGIKAYKNTYEGANVAIKSGAAQVVASTTENLWPDKLNFRVQVVASSSEKTIDSQGYTPISTVKENNINKYMVGIFATPEDAEAAQAKLKTKYPDCFVVAYEGTEKLTMKAARKKLKK